MIGAVGITESSEIRKQNRTAPLFRGLVFKLVSATRSYQKLIIKTTHRSSPCRCGPACQTLLGNGPAKEKKRHSSICTSSKDAGSTPFLTIDDGRSMVWGAEGKRKREKRIVVPVVLVLDTGCVPQQAKKATQPRSRSATRLACTCTSPRCRYVGTFVPLFSREATHALSNPPAHQPPNLSSSYLPSCHPLILINSFFPSCVQVQIGPLMI